MPETNVSGFHPSVVAAVQELHSRFEDVPFLTLGQTVLWDEPIKAAFCRMLEHLAPRAQMMAAVHDTDYFAKLAHVAPSDEKFALLPHNDGATRDLWSAAGELSCFFGSETVPTRALLSENGVAFDRVARGYNGGLDALLDNETQAWGWRAIVHTEPHPLIAADVKLRDILPALRAQLQWGFDESLKIVGADSNITSRILDWVNEYANGAPDASLSDLYRALTPKLWATVRGAGSCDLQSGVSLELFQFNRQTASLPRFCFVDLFLQPATRELARRCYDEAVRGSGIYQLSQFGDGALPFDVVIPGRGRGTLRLHDGSLYIETEDPITLCTGCDCGSIDELADALETKFGAGVALVGKAVALISMLASEFIFVFHERASSYTARTQQMNDCLREAGIELKLYPMLRLQYFTWNALENVQAEFQLPPHLARAFDTDTISAPDFATRWESVCDAQDALRHDLKSCQSPRDLMTLLAARENSDNSSGDNASDETTDWAAKLFEYSNARAAIKALRERTGILESEIETLHHEARAANEHAAQTEREKGEDWRAHVQPLRQRLFDLKEEAANRLATQGKMSKEERVAAAETEAQNAREEAELRERIAWCIKERARFDDEIAAQRNRARDSRTQARAKTQERVTLEKSPEISAARQTISRLELEAEWQRFQLVRDSILVSKGLRYTNFRPTAWWFPLVSPDGRWFDALVKTAQARIEKL